MSEISGFAETCLDVGGTTLLHGTALAMITWILASTVMRKARPALHAALWTVVLLKFLIPPILPGEMALSGLIGSLGHPSFGSGGGGDPAWSPPTGPAGFQQTASDSLPVMHDWPWPTLLLAAYLGLLAFLVGKAFLQAWRASRELGRLASADSGLQEQVAELAAGLGVRPPRIRVTERSVSPCVVGVIRPTLVVPTRLLGQIEPAARRALLAHELAHLRRGDLLIRLAQNTVRTLFFFWPPAWWVCRRVEGLAEMACDQWAVSVSRVPPHVYAQSLLHVVRAVVDSPRAGPALAFAGQERILEERFKMILQRSRSFSPGLSRMMILSLALWASFALAGGSQPGEQEEQAVGEKRIRRIEVVLPGAETEVLQLLDDVLLDMPEADLDGDGKLTLEELRNFTHDDGEGGRYVFLQSPADAGRLLSEGKRAHGIVIVRQEETAEGRDEMEVEAHRVIRGDSGEALVRKPVEFDITVAGDFSADFLRRHPEADVDGDGQASPEEVQQFFGERGNALYVRKEVLDLNHEGEEAADYTWTTDDGQQVRIEIRGFGEEMDSDGDGTVSQAEARAFLEARGVPHLPAVPLPRAADLDGDGRISEEEILAHRGDLSRKRRQAFVEKHPEADLNGDGQIDQAEAEALARKLQLKKQ